MVKQKLFMKINFFILLFVILLVLGELFFRNRSKIYDNPSLVEMDDVIGAKHINKFGFRGPEVKLKDKNTIRIAFVGESTTYCPFEAVDSLTWPHLVCNELSRQNPLVKFDYLNCSMPGNRMRSINKRVLFVLRKVEPDIVVIMQGFNDLNSLSKEVALKNKCGCNDNSEPNSILDRHSYLFRWVSKNVTITLMKAKELFGLNQKVKDFTIITETYKNDFEYFLENIDNLSSFNVLITLSTKITGIKNNLQKIREGDIIMYHFPCLGISGFEMGITSFNSAIQQFKNEKNSILNNILDSKYGAYFDAIHLNSKGHQLISKLVSEKIMSTKKFQTLLDEKMTSNGNIY